MPLIDLNKIDIDYLKSLNIYELMELQRMSIIVMENKIRELK